MKALLMHPDRDFEPKRDSPRPERELVQDLGLETLLSAMAGKDELLLDVALRVLLSGFRNDMETILYRQDVLKDCLRNPAVVRELYGIAGEALDRRRQPYLGFLGRYPSGILHGSVDWLQMFVGMLRRLRDLADRHGGGFQSRGFRRLFGMLQQELSDDYFARVEAHLATLRFRSGVLLSAALGRHNEGTDYTLRLPRDPSRNWFRRLLASRPPGYTFRIPERDEAGSRALSELRDRGINEVANAAAQSAEHIRTFFETLRREAAFYVCCLNLRDRLAALGVPIAFPGPKVAGTRALRFRALCDVSLALNLGPAVVGNSLDADGKSLVIITGANQGGKSSFLRGVGLAQLMMQCGMFVGAESFTAELCSGLFTHYKREEDATMKRGKLDEELARMSEIVDAIGPNAMLLLNESFAATNEREGSEIARQVVQALLAKRVRIFFVTHLYPFAHGMLETAGRDALFLRAERRPDGTRTFKLLPGEPLETSYGEDLYREIFAGAEASSA